MATAEFNHVKRMSLAGLLAWLLPGLGHLYLGERRRGFILLVVIGTTFWGGMAMGGVTHTINPQERTAWFMAQISTGSHALAAVGLKRLAADLQAPYSWRADEVAVVYTGVAGLLNLLVILDALARAEAPAPAPAREPSAARSPRRAT